MTMPKSVAALLTVHSNFHIGRSPGGKTEINLVEHGGDNTTWVTEQYDKLTGSSLRHEAWCAETVCVAAWYAGKIIPIQLFSMSARGLADILASVHHCHLAGPEPGAQVCYDAGDGHTGTVLEHVEGTTWIVGEGNYGNSYQWVKRDLANVPGGIYKYARMPGVSRDPGLKDWNSAARVLN